MMLINFTMLLYNCIIFLFKSILMLWMLLLVSYVITKIYKLWCYVWSTDNIFINDVEFEETLYDSYSEYNNITGKYEENKIFCFTAIINKQSDKPYYIPKLMESEKYLFKPNTNIHVFKLFNHPLKINHYYWLRIPSDMLGPYIVFLTIISFIVIPIIIVLNSIVINQNE